MIECWAQLGGAKPKSLAAAARQAHTAAQWLGRFGRGLTPPKSDDSHTSFSWRSDMQAFVTGPAQPGLVFSAPTRMLQQPAAPEADEQDEAGAERPSASEAVAADRGPDVRLALRPADLRLLVWVDDDVEAEFALHDASDEAVGGWVRRRLERLGFDLQAFDAPPPYKGPDSLPGGGVYDALGPIAELAELARCYDNAARVLESYAQKYAWTKPGPSPVRAWPHHFDIGTFIGLEDGDSQTARAVGAGLAAPDALYPEYYFYAYPWPRHPRKGLKRLRAKGRYHKNGFFGAALPLSTVIDQKSQAGAVTAFFDETIEIWKDLLYKEME